MKNFFRKLYSEIKLSIREETRKIWEENRRDILLGTTVAILFYFFAFVVYVSSDVTFIAALGQVIGITLLYFCLIFGVFLGFLILPFRLYSGVVSYEKSTLTNASYRNIVAISFMILLIGADDNLSSLFTTTSLISGNIEIESTKGFLGLVMFFSLITYIISLYGDGIKISLNDKSDQLMFGYVNTPYLILCLTKYIILPTILLYVTALDVGNNAIEIFYSVFEHIYSLLKESNSSFSRFIIALVDGFTNKKA